MRTQVIVIGAGISGLVCAKNLAAAGISVRILEKSRSLAGRCASRKFESAIIDTGVQYLTATTPGFSKKFNALLGSSLGVVDRPVLDADLNPIIGAGERLYHVDGNNRIGKLLANGLDITLDSPVLAIEPDGGGWRVGEFSCDAVVSCAPWPQSAAMLGLQPTDDYDRCLTAAFAYNGDPSGVASFAYAICGDDDLPWSSCENTKAGRVPSGTSIFICQAGSEFSANHFESPPELWADILRAKLEALWRLDAGKFRTHFTHRWKFSFHRQPAPAVDLPDGVFITGDSFCASRVDDVWMAGESTAAAVVEWINKA